MLERTRLLSASVALLFFLQTALAQEPVTPRPTENPKPKKDSLLLPGALFSFSAGYSLQINHGDPQYAPNDLTAHAGPVLSGLTLQVAADFPSTKRIGFALKLRNQHFNMDERQLLFQCRRSFPSYEWKGVSSAFVLNSLSAGINYLPPNMLSNRLHASLNFMIGFGNVTTPRISAEGICKDSAVWITAHERSFRSFTYLAGFHVYYDLSPLVSLNFNMDYQYSTYKPEIPYSSTNLNGTIPLILFPGNFSTINLLMGLGFTLR